MGMDMCMKTCVWDICVDMCMETCVWRHVCGHGYGHVYETCVWTMCRHAHKCDLILMVLWHPTLFIDQCARDSSCVCVCDERDVSMRLLSVFEL